MNRRDFIKTAGTGAAVLGVAACAPKAAKSAIEEPKNAPELSGEMAQNFPGVSLLGYGCMRWPMVEAEDGKKVIDQQKVNEMVDFAIEHGVNYFDASPTYLGGECETATSIALNRHPREKWLLATKMSNFSNWTLENSKKMYQESLRIYQTDHIDYYLLHSIGNRKTFDTRFGDTGIMPFLLEEREKGHIRNLGFSFHGSPEGLKELLELHETYHWDFVQIQMNYIDWFEGPAKELYDMLDALEIPVVIMEPLLGGKLGSVPAPLAQRMKEREPGRSVASWAFRFCGTYPRVLTVLSGMTYMEHLQDNVITYSPLHVLTDEDNRFLFETAQLIQKYPLIPCNDCKYCMPCPYGIDIPAVLTYYNKRVTESSLPMDREDPAYRKLRKSFLDEYDRAVPALRQANHCIGCRTCVEECPQKIDIPRQLQRIDEYVEHLKQNTL